jgi:hypothetical protein
MKLRQIARKIQAIAALFAMLATGVAGLAESLPASGVPPCCNTIYCPVHQRQVREQQRDKSICDSQGKSSENNCSMRACDTMAAPVVGTAPFVLVAPLAMRSPSGAEPAQIQARQFFPFLTSIPLTPPPRTLPS